MIREDCKLYNGAKCTCNGLDRLYCAFDTDCKFFQRKNEKIKVQGVRKKYKPRNVEINGKRIKDRAKELGFTFRDLDEMCGTGKNEIYAAAKSGWTHKEIVEVLSKILGEDIQL